MSRCWTFSNSQLYIAILTSASGVITSTSLTFAQVRPDNTLGTENSQVNPDVIRGVESDRIGGGAQRGDNLFHSFEQFDVLEGRGAYFENPANVQNIFSRVTGGDRSEIFGRLGVLGDANLFFLNPNGIVFGPNSSLDVSGSFVGTTADAIGFGEQGIFSATKLDSPSPLLTINPSAFLFTQLNAPAPIINQSVARFPANPAFIDGLRVNDGRSLLLLAGEIQLQSGKLTASGGRLELGAVTGAGAVGLAIDGSDLDLRFPAELQLGNLDLADSIVEASGIQSFATPGGNIQLQGDQIRLTNASITSNNFSREPNGTIALQANQLNASNSFILTNAQAAGTGGDIWINADTVNLNGSGISTFGIGQGNAGNIGIQSTSTVNLINQTNIGSLFLGSPLAEAGGSSGNVSIETRDFNIENAGILVSTFLGQEVGGSITIKADHSIHLDEGILATSSLGASSSGNVSLTSENVTFADGSSILTSAVDPTLLPSIIDLNPDLYPPAIVDTIQQLLVGVEPGSFGQADSGNVTIVARGDVQVLDGSSITTSTLSQGRGGTIEVMADTIEIAGTLANGQNVSRLFSESLANSTGNAGDVEVSTRLLNIHDGGQISTGTSGQGQAGNLNITAREAITLSGNATLANGQVRASGIISSINPVVNYSGNRSAGDITIHTGLLTINNSAQIQGNVEAGSVGEGADISITADSISLTDGGQIQSILREGDPAANLPGGQGRSGSMSLDIAGNLNIRGRSADGFPSGIFTTAGSETIGDAGSIAITANSMRLADGAIVSSVVSGQGNGGNLTIDASTISLINDALISADTFGQGRGGDITITTDRLVTQEGGQISAGSGRQGISGDFGRGGNVTITSTGLIEVNGVGNLNRSGVFAETSSPSRAGDVTINTERLVVRNGAAVSAGSSGSGSLGGKGGNLIVNATESIDVIGQGSGRNSAIVAEANGVGNAGNLRLITDRLNIRNGAQVTSSTLGRGDAGTIVIQADAVNLSNGILSSTIGLAAIGNPGDIRIQARSLSLSNNAQITASSAGQGNAGNIIVQNAEEILLSDSAISTEVQERATGRGGSIELNTANLRLENGSSISAQSQTTNRAGDIQINATGTLLVDDSTILTAAPQSSGGAIDVNTGDDIDSGFIVLRNGDIRTQSRNNAGDITLSADGIIALDDSDIITSSQNQRGGNITLAPFFSETVPPDSDQPFDGDGHVDVNAEGEVESGAITTPDTTFIQNSLNELPTTAIDTNTLLANSCIVRDRNQGRFTITGLDGLPERPGDTAVSSYSTGTIRSIPNDNPSSHESSSWQIGDAIVEPQEVYQLPNGQLVLSRECS